MSTTRISWRYVAGFFDGEGSLTHNGHGYRITISQTHYRVLTSICQRMGYGSVTRAKVRQAHWKPSWILCISRQSEVHDFLVHISPYAIVKKRKIDVVVPEVRKVLKRQRIRVRQASIHRQEARRLRQQGHSYRQIGQRLGLDWGYVRRVVLGNGVKP